MAKWGSPLAFLRWLSAGEILDDTPLEHACLNSAGQRGFLRWLISSETLPYLEPGPQETHSGSLLRFIFSPDRLDGIENDVCHSETSKEEGRNES